MEAEISPSDVAPKRRLELCLGASLVFGGIVGPVALIVALSATQPMSLSRILIAGLIYLIYKAATSFPSKRQ